MPAGIVHTMTVSDRDCLVGEINKKKNKDYFPNELKKYTLSTTRLKTLFSVDANEDYSELAIFSMSKVFQNGATVAQRYY